MRCAGCVSHRGSGQPRSRMEAIMLEILVYYHDVLRYSLLGDWNKVRELQQQGYYVKVKIPVERR